MALYAAHRILRPQPWSGLFVDAFEHVYDHADRVAILEAIDAVGVLDNVFVAGAFDAGDAASAAGVTWHRRSAASSATRPTT
jgi:hypothetical protein